MTWPLHRTIDLQREGVLLVEDGNHGEYRPRPDEFNTDGTSFIRAGDLKGDIDFGGASRINDVALNRIRKGIGSPLDVVLTHKGTVGRVAIARRDCPPFVLSPQTTFWRSLRPDKIDPHFLRYAIESQPFQVQLREAQGSTDMAPYVSLTDQRQFLLPLPDLRTQIAIAAVLGALDDKITANIALVRTTDRLADAHLERSLHAECPTPTLLERVVTFHNRRRIPLSSRERQYRIGLVPYYGAAGPIDTVDEALFDMTLVLVGEDGSVVTDSGSPVVQYIWGPAWVNNHAHVLTGVGVSTELLSVILRRADVRPLVTGAVQPKLSMGKLKSLEINVPNPSELPGLEATVDSMSALKRSMSAENDTLTALRDTLLPALMSGQLRVKDAERQVEEAV